MAYRFVLDVPEAMHEDAEAAIVVAPHAEVLISRQTRSIDPDRSYTEITVVAHTLDIVDHLYAWATARSIESDVFLEAHKGGRLSLSAYDETSLRRVIQGDQYWFENTIPIITHRIDPEMKGGALVADVPYGGRLANGSAVQPADREVTFDSIDHIALRVREIAHAERFYQNFFGMDVIYRARQEDDRWVFLDEDFDWEVSIHTGIRPDFVRMENGPIALVLIDVGIGMVLHEERVSYISVRVSRETFNDIRGRALFSSYSVLEETPQSFRFIDPFGMVWQLVVE